MVKRALFAVVLCTVLATARPAPAYSVLAHEANVDAAWEPAIEPLLKQKFPRATATDVTAARAFAYGGSVIQDLGYYPFGSHLFSNLVHYVRSGDFVEALLRQARDINEYAFGLGALAHYVADTSGHPLGVNRSVPLMFPKLAAKYGPQVTYADSPATHILVEFSFDVLQAAAGAYVPDAYHNFIGFEVSVPALERAFRDTYGLELREVFKDMDLAIGTYRRGVSEIIPQITEIAWRDKREEIMKLVPAAEREKFVFRLSRQDYEREFGTSYQKPGFIARLFTFLYKLLPKIGPLRPLKFKAPTPEAEKLFVESFRVTRDRYRQTLAAVRAGRLDLANTDFDTGQRSRHGEYELADKTYVELLEKLASHRFAGASAALRADINRYYGPADRLAARDSKERKRLPKVRRYLAELNPVR